MTSGHWNCCACCTHHCFKRTGCCPVILWWSWVSSYNITWCCSSSKWDRLPNNSIWNIKKNTVTNLIHCSYFSSYRYYFSKYFFCKSFFFFNLLDIFWSFESEELAMNCGAPSFVIPSSNCWYVVWSYWTGLPIASPNKVANSLKWNAINLVFPTHVCWSYFS